jgi:hypothetical protein
VTWAGQLGLATAKLERWSIGLRLNNTGSYGSVTTPPLNAAFATHLLPICSPSVHLDQVKVANIGADGKYTGNPVLYTGSGNGGGASPYYPFQVALTATLHTGTRGASARGRIYLPCPAYAISTDDGSISAANATDAATRVAAFITDVNAAMAHSGTGTQPVVSIVSSKGTVLPVVSVSVGRVLDTQRRRRRSLPEQYVADVTV